VNLCILLILVLASPVWSQQAAMPDTAVVVLSGPDNWAAPIALTVEADSLLFGDVLTLTLHFENAQLTAGAVLASSESWLVPGPIRSVEGSTQITVPLRVYHAGALQLVWSGKDPAATGILFAFGRLSPDAQPLTVRDPRSLGIYVGRIALAVLLLLAVLTAWLLLRRRGRAVDAIAAPQFTPPAWMVAARELYQLEQAGLPAKGEVREYLHGLDLAFRRYLGLRHRRDATEMTSTEVIAMLIDAGSGQEASRVRQWLSDCDYQRFSAQEIRPGVDRSMLAGVVREIDMTRETTCPEDVPGDWQFAAEQNWADVLAAVPGWRDAGKAGADV
jgi:hypothetical protein